MRMLAGWVIGFSWVSVVLAQRVPHNQDKPPGPALSPAQAIQQMTVPEGFTVEAVATEPDIVNPVAMTIDERGRFWITESLEYPRREAGPGQDRIKVLEDTDGDGKADKFTIFADGLNIPSGIAVGYGGVWVANAPDILFLQDTDGDGKADKQEVVVTGFGRFDTHELPNSLTWGPDGWLYGLNGVFNFGHVKYGEGNPNYTPDHPGWPITVALFRIHPRTREFQVFCEGTSNPWGIAVNEEGSLFISACVIDHLWHLVQTGYYHRQAGAYPPHTWKIESIVKHKHQKAAYCGITWFDSDAYPAEYRGRLFMGNIHGNCINSDTLQRAGSTYFATPEPDFLSANDAWFMPVVQKTGPDGCLYVLDWYDRYHCYQDANRDPAGIDRLKGRLYRVRYKDTPRAPQFDLSKETDDQLIERLGHPNIYFRETAQRILAERNTREITRRLGGLALAAKTPDVQRRHARFTLLSCDLIGSQSDDLEFRWARDFLKQATPEDRVWGVRCLAEHCLRSFRNPRLGRSEAHDMLLFEMLGDAAVDEDPRVRLEAIITVGLVGRGYGVPVHQTYVADYPALILTALGQQCDDPLLHRMAWQSLQPWIDAKPAYVQEILSRSLSAWDAPDKEVPVLQWPALQALLPRIIEKYLSHPGTPAETMRNLFDLLAQHQPEQAASFLGQLAGKLQTQELAGERSQVFRSAFLPRLEQLLAGPMENPLTQRAAFLATSWQVKSSYKATLGVLDSGKFAEDQRVAALEALVAAGEDDGLAAVARVFEQKPKASPEFRSRLMVTLGRLDDPEVAQLLLHFYPQLEPELQPRAIEVLTQRIDWAQRLLALIKAGKLPTNALNVNQVRKLLALKNEELTKQVTATWGTIRDARDPAREMVLAEMRKFVRQTPGDALKGQKVFEKVCGQCHKIYGNGQDVGPDITLNGRNSFDQLLSNVFDPSLVIGAAYQARTVVTTDGRVLTGLVTEDTPERLVLKVQGGKLETLPVDQIDEMKQSALSMMPEGLEKQLMPQELADLFAFLVLDKPPTDPSAKALPGSRE